MESLATQSKKPSLMIPSKPQLLLPQLRTAVDRANFAPLVSQVEIHCLMYFLNSMGFRLALSCMMHWDGIQDLYIVPQTMSEGASSSTG